MLCSFGFAFFCLNDFFRRSFPYLGLFGSLYSLETPTKATPMGKAGGLYGGILSTAAPSTSSIANTSSKLDSPANIVHETTPALVPEPIRDESAKPAAGNVLTNPLRF